MGSVGDNRLPISIYTQNYLETTYIYNSRGMLELAISPDGTRAQRCYDALDRLKQIKKAP